MKKALFIDRDGTLIIEPPDEQIDSLEKLEFYPFVFSNLQFIKQTLDFELVIVSNQDGLGSSTYPQAKFDLVQEKMLTAFKNEGIDFDAILIDPTRKEDNAPTRKPGVGMLTNYIKGGYDLKNSFVIGDRITDIELAKNLGSKGILISKIDRRNELKQFGLDEYCVLITDKWTEIRDYLTLKERTAKVNRATKETQIEVELNVDGSGKSVIETGLGFFDHMLEQIARHSGCDFKIKVKGDLQVDEHHTMEDTALALGEAFEKALGNKKGIDRYGFVLPMDDCLAQVVIDFSGRNDFVWDVEFKREKVGDVPTEMFKHFFKSFSDSLKCNLNIKAEGENEHHKAEAIFKGLGRAIRMAKRRDVFNSELPSTKGVL